MKIIKASIEILAGTSNILQTIEKAGRTCYKSESKITDNSADNFIKNIIKRGHESVIEHGSLTVRVICDRGVSHEIVRHRIASYSQESTRYVNYKEGIEVIKPCFWEDNPQAYHLWEQYMDVIERGYKNLIESGATPEQARTVLPNSLKTEIVMTMNLREWRHFLKIRCEKHSHPQIREIAFLILEKFQDVLPSVFGDLSKEK